MNGRFGAYVTDGVVNASLPKGIEPARLTVERAVELLEAREARMKEQGKDPRAPKAAKGGARRKAAAPKAATEAKAPAAPRAKKAAGGRSASK